MENILSKLDEPLRILVLDDDKAIIDTISLFLENEDHIDMFATQDGQEALSYVKKKSPHVVLTDLKMPDITGLEILKSVKKIDKEIEVVIMTAHASTQSAIETMKEGAYDYLIKPFKMIELKSILHKIVHAQVLEKKNIILEKKLSKYEKSRKFIGSSEKMRKIKDLIDVVADNNTSMLITGESGTGKSMLAEEIHIKSNRAKYPFVTIECASIPKDLLESELFGYEKGSFTGAETQKIGKMEKAQKGTLFLDEIGDMSLALQAKMLRVLQERELCRVGGTEHISIDVRIIAATNKNLSAMVAEGGFREDLFYRLSVIPVVMPALRERLEDIPELTEILMKKICLRLGRDILKVDKDVLKKLMEYEWPGNVRQLENVLERTIIFEHGDTLNNIMFEDDLYEDDEPEDSITFDIMNEQLTLTAIEKTLAEKALEKTNGDHKKAASILGVDPDKFNSLISG
ncbi:MAG: sigma-54-dependent Fis family transcriptional regulator [Spirochaetes bacterium]|nr:sigma-54-dependent Fis family transcriptional regulator [Spirochaetota bacterium]